MWWSWFLHADKHESLLQIDTMILMAMFKHSQSPKIASWEFLYNISKKKKKKKKMVTDKVDFLHQHQSFNKLALSFLMEVAKLVQSTQNRNSVIFWKYTKKKEWQMLLCSVVIPNIQIFYGVQSCSLLLVFQKVRTFSSLSCITVAWTFYNSSHFMLF